MRTACPLDCPDTCSLEVEVADGRLVSVGAAPAGPDTNPMTQGWICAKVRRHAERVHGPDRVLTPLVRTGEKGEGRFSEVSWDEATDRVAESCRQALDRHGPAALVPYLYNSSAGVLAASALAPLLWRALGATHVPHTLCAAPSSEARRLVMGRLPSADPRAVLDASLVVVWGANPSVSNTHWQSLVAQAQRRGARLVVVDPRRIPLAARADVHLALRPGTDVVAALALAHRLAELGGIDEAFVADHVEGATEHLAAAAAWPLDRAADTCGVEASDLDAVAGLLAEVRPAFFRPGWGMERNTNGGSAWRAVLGLAALTGNIGRSGAGLYWSTSRAFGWDEDALATSVMGQSPPPPARVLAQHRLADWLGDPDLSPPVAVLFVQGANPAVMCPDQSRVLAGLARPDVFCVVHDQVLTDTARFADVVLPATTHFEAADVTSSYGSFGSEVMPPVIPRVGESRTNDEVAVALAARLGLSGFDADPAALAQAGGRAELAQALGGGHHGWRPVDPGPQEPRTRIRLAVDEAGVDPVATYREPPVSHPLSLLSPAGPRAINSVFGERARTQVLSLHPDDASDRSIGEGQLVRVWNDRGSVLATAHLDSALRPGVVAITKGAWLRAAPGGTVNMLTPTTEADLGGGACFHDARVEVTAVP